MDTKQHSSQLLSQRQRACYTHIALRDGTKHYSYKFSQKDVTCSFVLGKHTARGACQQVDLFASALNVTSRVVFTTIIKENTV